MDAGAIARRWIELYNDVPTGTYGSDRFLELYAADCRWREMPSAYAPQGRGSDHGLDHATLERAAAVFVDRRADLHQLVADSQSAAMRYEWSATVKADLGPSAPAIGSRLKLEVAAFLRVDDDKITEITEILSAALPTS